MRTAKLSLNHMVNLAATGGVVLGWWAARGQKSQAVRAVDVVALGPFLVWAAGRPGRLERGARALLALAGGATVGYNARNWWRTRQLERATLKPG